MDFCCRLILSACLVATLSFFAFVFSLGAQQAPPPAPSPSAKFISTADKDCLQCHGAKGTQPVGDIAATKHGTAADRRGPGCRSCHGESAAHIANPKSAKTDYQFHAKAATEPAKQNAQCLTCHRGGHMILWPGSPHQSQDVTCASCHKMHAARDPVMTKGEQTQVCATCHKQQHVQLKKPSRHPILEGKVQCSDCHNPHGSAGPALMARDNVNDTCFICHAEKRGPFIWNHQPVTENCALCHEPHGSTVASMLKWRQPFLCQQCHEITSHRGAIPSLTAPGTTTGIGSTLARACVSCHTNIHGSNNPTNSAGSRSFRR